MISTAQPGVSLSIVVPVYDVAGYLPSCLDSILSARLPALEVIAVNDGSSTAAGTSWTPTPPAAPACRCSIWRQTAARGRAREAGLREARGEYVWFVDGDDWLADGAVDEVADRLATVRPDILITGFTRSYPDGTTRPGPPRRPPAGPPLPGTFTLEDSPDLLQMIMSVWNKVARRDFLDSLGVRFGDGFYEDISVAYPMLLGAKRLSCLDRDVYFYRRLRPGAITNTQSARHMDVFAQYDAIFDFLDRRPEIPAQMRRLVFDRTVKQAVTVLDTPGLVPDQLRETFFRRTAEHFQRRRPPGYAYPKGLRGIQYRLVALGAWAAHQRLRSMLPRTREQSVSVPAIRGSRRRSDTAVAIPGQALPGVQSIPGSRLECMCSDCYGMADGSRPPWDPWDWEAEGVPDVFR